MMQHDSPPAAVAMAIDMDGWYSWRRAFYSVLIGMITNASMWTSVTLMPVLQSEFGLTRTEASYPYIAIMFGYLVGGPVLGRWSDRYGVANILVVSSILASLGYLVGAMMHSFWPFLLTQLFVGLGAAVGLAPLTADISHWFRKRRGMAITVVSSAGYLSGALWAIIIGNMVRDGSWRDVHLLIGGVLLMVVPLSFLLRRRVPSDVLDEADRSSSQKAKHVGLSPLTIKSILVLAAVSCCIAMAIPQIHIVALCGDLGFTVSQGSELISMMLLGGIASRFVCGAIIDIVGPVTILFVGSLLQMLALTFYIHADGLASLQLVSVVFGLAQGGILPSYPLIVREYLPARSAGAIIGVVAAGNIFGMAFGGWISGWIYDQTGSYFVAFLNGIGWNGLNVILIGSLVLRMRTPPAGQTRRVEAV
ncbi:MFS transporter [Bosea sp. (in: a-proteobacteria)]|uniref:MFS transporter n=1 Tax=Bosea sp. (in: a-proteobacteria) TaxID=1871050 RepID=UPI00262AFFC5|nr:MFS transporter [Bosea sp. (in: a-proteobacteria)]MCO5092180.1 MFS transporter [Bosea sp. (in: a-proteobacteria)]